MRSLYCDESVWIPVADGLRRRGWTVHTARDIGDVVKTVDAHLESRSEDDRRIHYC